MFYFFGKIEYQKNEYKNKQNEPNTNSEKLFFVHIQNIDIFIISF